jgi:hypothetical protein
MSNSRPLRFTCKVQAMPRWNQCTETRPRTSLFLLHRTFLRLSGPIWGMTNTIGVLSRCVTHTLLFFLLIEHSGVFVTRSAQLNWTGTFPGSPSQQPSLAMRTMWFVFFRSAYHFIVLMLIGRGWLLWAVLFRQTMGCPPYHKGSVGKRQHLPQLC